VEALHDRSEIPPGFDPTELVVIRSLTFFWAFVDESTNGCTTIAAMTSETGPKSS
jgi:hypothetical protein